MKKPNKLKLNRESLKTLSDADLKEANGGTWGTITVGIASAFGCISIVTCSCTCVVSVTISRSPVKRTVWT